MLLRDWSTSFITPVGNLRPPKASGGRPLCVPQGPGDWCIRHVSLWRCAKKTNKHFYSCYLHGSGNIRHQGWYITRKNRKPYKSYIIVPLPAAHRADRLVFCDWILQQPEGLNSMWYGRIRNGFCCKLVSSSKTKDIGPLWATDWLRRARNRGEGAISRRCC